jgi:hypothetical protein
LVVLACALEVAEVLVAERESEVIDPRFGA